MAKERINFLIVCWDFPPNEAIGGRRWAKMAKAFINAGHSVRVICKEPLDQTKSKWISKEVLSKISFYYLKQYLVARWLTGGNSATDKIKAVIARLYLKTFFRGTIFDKAIGIKRQFISLVDKTVTEHNIDILLATGAPFNLLYYASLVKRNHPELILVSDFRDPWLDAENYGMKQLSKANFYFEQKKHTTVLDTSDFVTAPNSFLLEDIRRKVGPLKNASKFITLPHAFDPDDHFVSLPNEKKKDGRPRIVYAGTLYLGTEKYIALLDAALNYFNVKNPELKPEIDVFSVDSENFARRMELASGINLHPDVGSSVFEHIANADFILILLSDHNKDYLTSKFFEYLPYRKPYIYVGPKGYVSEKIESEKLGFCIFEACDLYLKLKDAKNYESPQTAKYSFDNVASEFIKAVWK